MFTEFIPFEPQAQRDVSIPPSAINFCGKSVELDHVVVTKDDIASEIYQFCGEPIWCITSEVEDLDIESSYFEVTNNGRQCNRVYINSVTF
jgi:hypothetical protein